MVFQCLLSLFFLNFHLHSRVVFSQENLRSTMLFVTLNPGEIPLNLVAAKLARIQERMVASWTSPFIKILEVHWANSQGGRQGWFLSLE